MKIFGDPGVQEQKGGVPEVKEEILYGHGFNRRGNRGGFRGGSRGFSRGGTGRGGFRDGKTFYKNYATTDGKVLRCHVCDSTKHFVRECPHKYDC